MSALTPISMPPVSGKISAAGGNVWNPYTRPPVAKKRHQSRSIAITAVIAAIAIGSLAIILHNGFGSYDAKFTQNGVVMHQTIAPFSEIFWAILFTISAPIAICRLLIRIPTFSSAVIGFTTGACFTLSFFGFNLAYSDPLYDKAEAVTDWLKNDLKTSLTYSALFTADEGSTVTAFDEDNKLMFLEHNRQGDTIKITVIHTGKTEDEIR